MTSHNNDNDKKNAKQTVANTTTQKPAHKGKPVPEKTAATSASDKPRLKADDTKAPVKTTAKTESKTAGNNPKTSAPAANSNPVSGSDNPQGTASNPSASSSASNSASNKADKLATTKATANKSSSKTNNKSAQNKQNKKSGNGAAKGIALLALLLAIIAAVAVAYMWWKNQQQSDLYTTALDESRQLTATQTQLASDLKQQISALQTNLTQLEQARSNNGQQLNALNQRTNKVEQQLQRNLDIADDQREVLQMAEVISRINYGMRAAQLDNNPTQAATALSSARDLLIRIDAGKYSSELSRLQTAITTLKSRQLEAKTTEWIGDLNSLVQQTANLTVLQPESAGQSSTNGTASEADIQKADEPWYAVPERIDLRPFFYFENEQTARLANILPSEATALKQNLAMHFTVANMQLAQGNTAALKQVLTGAKTFMQEWFVQDSAYATMVTLIDKIEKVEPAPELTNDLTSITTLVDELRERSRVESQAVNPLVNPQGNPAIGAP